MELANRVQMVMNTLEQLDIKANYDTMNKLLGCLQALAKVRDELIRQQAVSEDPPVSGQDGDTDA